MSRSNLDKPFYVDVGTSIVAVRCASNHDVVLRYDHSWRPSSIELARTACDRMNKEAEIRNSGNCAKLREACANIAEYARSAMCHTEDAHVLGYLNQIEGWAKAALAARPRNCNIGTVKEQLVRYTKFCYAHRSYEKGCGGCPLNGEPCCEFAWAQMPYEEGGAE